MKSLYKNIEESILDDPKIGIKRTLKNLPITEWLHKYKGDNFKEGRDFTIEYEDDEPIISIKNYEIDLSGSTHLDMINIKWPNKNKMDEIQSVCLLYDDYLTPQWFKNNFDGKKIYELSISCKLNLPELDLKFINQCDADFDTITILGEHEKTKILIPPMLNCRELHIFRSKNIRFPKPGTRICDGSILIDYEY
jgi:hypothetical protein